MGGSAASDGVIVPICPMQADTETIVDALRRSSGGSDVKRAGCTHGDAPGVRSDLLPFGNHCLYDVARLKPLYDACALCTRTREAEFVHATHLARSVARRLNQ